MSRRVAQWWGRLRIQHKVWAVLLLLCLPLITASVCSFLTMADVIVESRDADLLAGMARPNSVAGVIIDVRQLVAGWLMLLAGLRERCPEISVMTIGSVEQPRLLRYSIEREGGRGRERDDRAKDRPPRQCPQRAPWRLLWPLREFNYGSYKQTSGRHGKGRLDQEDGHYVLSRLGDLGIRSGDGLGGSCSDGWGNANGDRHVERQGAVSEGL